MELSFDQNTMFKSNAREYYRGFVARKVYKKPTYRSLGLLPSTSQNKPSTFFDKVSDLFKNLGTRITSL